MKTKKLLAAGGTEQPLGIFNSFRCFCVVVFVLFFLGFVFFCFVVWGGAGKPGVILGMPQG